MQWRLCLPIRARSTKIYLPCHSPNKELSSNPRQSLRFSLTSLVDYRINRLSPRLNLESLITNDSYVTVFALRINFFLIGKKAVDQMMKSRIRVSVTPKTNERKVS